MSKWFGTVGYFVTEEIAPGYWEEKITERQYYGEAIKTSFRAQQDSNTTVDDININTQISIIADPFAYAHFSTIKYVEYMGTLWKVRSADIQFPRLNLSLGGVYNGQSSQTTAEAGGYSGV